MNRHKNSVAFSMNISLSFKILVVGNRNAGKTSLIIRYIKDIFDFNYKVTIGVEFYSKILQIGNGNGEENEEIALQIWDTVHYGYDRVCRPVGTTISLWYDPSTILHTVHCFSTIATPNARTCWKIGCGK